MFVVGGFVGFFYFMCRICDWFVYEVIYIVSFFDLGSVVVWGVVLFVVFYVDVIVFCVLRKIYGISVYMVFDYDCDLIYLFEVIVDGV